ncbi:polyprenyl synthetase family protein [Propionicimonas sp.]|jgi:heptaprenyl diphosphate synthase|uniref:polyprenyl synthetase family protein n=1 Tax=Propionicimonas sp. TaxID=1955623 RepID=UPI0039C9DF8A
MLTSVSTNQQADLVGDLDEAFTARVTELLDRIEERLADSAVADTDFVTVAAQHTIRAGGKRFRPLLVVLAALLADDVDEDALVRAALVMELTHVASLYHDDVMDEAELRRGAPTANLRWNNTVAILVGDFLFSRASSIVASLGTEYVELQAATFARLVQGQIAETRGPLDGEDLLAHYLRVLEDKTGSLIAASAIFGGMVAGVGEPVLKALAAYGEEIGVVFQLSDDIIDIASDSSGKTPGTDLRAGVPTLPILLARRSTDPSDARLLALLDADLSSDADLSEALGLMRAHPAMAEAREEILRRAEVARGHLAPLPEGTAKQALAALCDGVISRSS